MCRECRAERRRAAPLVTREPRPPRPLKTYGCEICEARYRRTYSGQRTCGRACGVALRLRDRGYAGSRPAAVKPELCVVRYGECVGCGGLFAARSGHKKTCSEACARELNRKSQAAWNRENRARGPQTHCECGASLAAEHHGARRHCDDCRSATRLRRKQAERRRRKAVLKGKSREPYTLAEIAARDGYRCGICEAPDVNMSLVVPHPLAPTIDHVVALARGGDDMRANVQLAHFSCNCRKSDNVHV